MNTQACCTLAFCWKTSFLGKMKLLFLQNAQGCQLGTLQILIVHGLVVSNPLKTIVGPLLQGWAKNSTSAAGLIKIYTIRSLWWQGFQKYTVCICFDHQNPSYKWLKKDFYGNYGCQYCTRQAYTFLLINHRGEIICIRITNRRFVVFCWSILQYYIT